jgi:hypothetical protein
MFGSKNKNGLCDVCTVVNCVIGVIAIIASLLALIGVYKAHMLTEGMTFGTTSGSLALLALGINLVLVRKISMICGCQCKVK